MSTHMSNHSFIGIPTPRCSRSLWSSSRWQGVGNGEAGVQSQNAKGGWGVSRAGFSEALLIPKCWPLCRLPDPGGPGFAMTPGEGAGGAGPTSSSVWGGNLLLLPEQWHG